MRTKEKEQWFMILSSILTYSYFILRYKIGEQDNEHHQNIIVSSLVLDDLNQDVTLCIVKLYP